MFQSIIQDVRTEFQKGNTVTRLLFLNLFVFIGFNLLYVLLQGTSPSVYINIRHAFSLSTDWVHNATHPWVWITHMFLHDGFWHIAWNMLFLYWFGRIVGDLIGDHQILPLYLYGGIAGGLSYVFLAGYLTPGDTPSFALGASGATTAIVVAAGVIAPNYLMRLLLIGTVKLKYVVLAIILLDVFRLAGNDNVGGHIAHLGGAAMGWFYIRSLRNGLELGRPVMRFQRTIIMLFNQNRTDNRTTYAPYSQNNSHSSHTSSHRTESLQDRIDEILDKIRDKGFDSLSQEEKDILYDASKNG